MSNSQLSVAVIGSGNWGKNHVRVWDELGVLNAICDSDVDRLAEFSAQYPNAEMIPSADELFSRDDIDAVVIATPAFTHFDLAVRAMNAGFDVLVEKPMALTASEGSQLVEVASTSNRILMVGHVLEYHPAVTKLRDLLAEETLGQIRYIYSNRLNLGKIRTEENALWSFAPHDIAIILRMMGRMPQDVACHGAGYLNNKVADVTLTNLSFSEAVESHIYVSWLHPFKEQRFVVVGEKQMAVFDDTLPWEQKLVLYPHRIDWVDGQIPVAHRAESVAVELEMLEPLKEECIHFANAVVSREGPLSDGVSGLQVLQVLEAAQKSLDNKGMPISLSAERGRNE